MDKVLDFLNTYVGKYYWYDNRVIQVIEIRKTSYNNYHFRFKFVEDPERYKKYKKFDRFVPSHHQLREIGKLKELTEEEKLNLQMELL